MPELASAVSLNAILFANETWIRLSVRRPIRVGAPDTRCHQSSSVTRDAFQIGFSEDSSLSFLLTIHVSELFVVCGSLVRDSS